MKRDKRLNLIYKKLFKAFGPQHWWPGETPLEVAVGAILTQNTNWGNVERAIENLKAAGALNAGKLHAMPAKKLATLIRPAGYFTIKAKRLKALMKFLMNQYEGKMEGMRKEKAALLRLQLLAVHGIGPETADSVLLYALNKPVFVIDAYTRRILSRHSIMSHDAPYADYQDLFHRSLKRDATLYNEYHALLVRTGKSFCRPTPSCTKCPLSGFNGTGRR